MEQFTRFAIYYAPRPGAFADATARWLGWDAQAGCAAAQTDPGITDFAALTADPRKYGFHGTLKAPFRVMPGVTEALLTRACNALAARIAPVTLPGLHLGLIDGFLALTPIGDTGTLNALAMQVVQGFEPFRAPLTATEIARRNPANLTARQHENLMTYGYPYIRDDFQFHLTLTGRLTPDQAPPIEQAARQMLAPHIAGAFTLHDICLCGEHAQTRKFHVLHRAPLTA